MFALQKLLLQFCLQPTNIGKLSGYPVSASDHDSDNIMRKLAAPSLWQARVGPTTRSTDNPDDQDSACVHLFFTSKIQQNVCDILKF